MQEFRGGGAYFGERANGTAVDLKVILPEILSGMKQADELTAVAVDGCDIAALSPVAENAGVGEVFGKRSAAVFAADDVVHLGKEGAVLFADQAVFATAVRAAGDASAQRLVNVIGHWRESGARGPWPF